MHTDLDNFESFIDLGKIEEEKEKDFFNIRLKMNQFNFELMSFIRSHSKSQFIEDITMQQNGELPFLMSTMPTNLVFEVYCLKIYDRIITYIIHTNERITKLEDDYKMMNDGTVINQNIKLCIQYRMLKKKIVRSQRLIVGWLLILINKSGFVIRLMKEK